MGYLQKKYTKEYFTGRNKNGEVVGYGIEGYDAFLDGKIRQTDFSILEQLNFKNKSVLEFGYGRGEAIKYALEHGANSYEGVDFADCAKDIATSFLQKHNLPVPKLHYSDALEFLNKKTKSINFLAKYDIVLMFDFVEHVPRTELKKLFTKLQKVISNKSVIAINTPAYKFDNDVIKNGLDSRNNENTFDTSDLNKATSGMHCNKFSLISLKKFMLELGYLSISETHFYIPEFHSSSICTPYLIRWKNCFKKGFPLNAKYKDDLIEDPYQSKDKPSLISMPNGNLKGIRLILNDFYLKSAFPLGFHDKKLFLDFREDSHDHKVIFDVGGFMGVSSLLFAKTKNFKGKIIAFEPNPFNHNRMLVNFSHNNKLSQNIFTYEIALGNETKKTKFLLSSQIDNGFSSTSRLEQTHVEHSKSHLLELGFTFEEVKMMTLDDFVFQNKLVPDLIKVDVEGAEHLFLIGALKTLAKYHPVLYIELHSQYCTLICVEILKDLGYQYHLIDEENDGRIFIKFFVINKDKTERKNARKSSLLSEKTAKILLSNSRHSLDSAEQENRILLSKINELNIELKFKKKRVGPSEVEQDSKIEYLKKIISNPLIKIELSVFRILKSAFNRFRF